MINGDRIYLRYLTLKDSNFIHKIVNKEESKKYIGEEMSFSLPETKKWIREKNKQRKMGLRYDFVIINKKNKEKIGIIDIFNINKNHKNGTLGLMWIEKDYRNIGISKEATKILLKFSFEKLGLHKIKVYTYNPIAKKVLKSLKMKKEGLLREEILYKGKWINVNLFSILKKEFKN